VSGPGRSELGAAFKAVLHNRSLLRVLAAFCLFNAAEYGTWVAILVYAFGQGGTTEAGIVGLVLLVPPVFAAPVAASVGDRMRRDHALGLGYLVEALSFAGTAVALALDADPLVVYAAALVAMCAVTLTRPVHLSILPDLSDSTQELIAANSASATLEQLGVFLGPLANVALVAVGGAGLVFGVMAVALALAAVLTASLPKLAVEKPVEAPGGEETSNIWTDTREGAQELRTNPGLRSCVLLASMHWLVLGMVEVLAVSLAVDVLDMGEAGPATLLAGIGGFIGAVATVALVGRSRLVPVLLGSALAIGVSLLLMPAAVISIVALALLASSGAGSAFFDVSGRTLLQRVVPDDLLSRVFGLQESLQLAGMGLGSVAAPLSVALVGTKGSFVVASACLPVLGALSWRSLRGVEAETQPPGEGLETLRRVSPFDLLPTPTLERIARDLIPVHVAAGTAVITEGEPGDRFFVVAGGSLSVSMEGEYVRTITKGDYFGEIALLRDVPRTATVVAETDADLFALERAEFLATVKTSRTIAAHSASRSYRMNDRTGA